MKPEQPILETQHLSKSFRGNKVVDDLSFTISKGDIYGFLGPNGAGKSTTMRMLLGLIHPDDGIIKINGESFARKQKGYRLLRHIGAIIERPDLYGYLSGWDNLRMFAALSGEKISADRLYHLLELVNLKGREADKVKTYSQGMKQRLGIAIALAHSPDLLILDEPTNGLDPQGIAEMRELIIHLSAAHGKTILISSHLLYEIEQMATRMLILHRGKKIAEGSVQELFNREQTILEVSHEPDDTLKAALESSSFAPQLKNISAGHFSIQIASQEVPALAKWLLARDTAITGMTPRHSLEALFLSLTGAPNATATY